LNKYIKTKLKYQREKLSFNSQIFVLEHLD